MQRQHPAACPVAVGLRASRADLSIGSASGTNEHSCLEALKRGVLCSEGLGIGRQPHNPCEESSSGTLGIESLSLSSSLQSGVPLPLGDCSAPLPCLCHGESFKGRLEGPTILTSWRSASALDITCQGCAWAEAVLSWQWQVASATMETKENTDVKAGRHVMHFCFKKRKGAWFFSLTYSFRGDWEVSRKRVIWRICLSPGHQQWACPVWCSVSQHLWARTAVPPAVWRSTECSPPVLWDPERVLVLKDMPALAGYWEICWGWGLMCASICLLGVMPAPGTDVFQ